MDYIDIYIYYMDYMIYIYMDYMIYYCNTCNIICNTYRYIYDVMVESTLYNLNLQTMIILFVMYDRHNPIPGSLCRT